MEILSIIPARKNSKGILNKNIKNILGRPLISWTIDASKRSKFINRTIVSTDGYNIKNIAENYGAEVLIRPDHLSSDTAKSEDALLHVLSELAVDGYKPDLLVFLQCTSPLTQSEDIDNCIEKMITEDADSATTVTDFHYFLWKETENGAEGINHDKRLRLRRQDKTPEYLETGAVYIMKTDGFLKSKHRFFGKISLSFMPSERVKEVDVPGDLLVVEQMMQEHIFKRRLKKLPATIEVLFFDFDGVMTDDTLMLDENGKESVTCSREDGMGISLLHKAGVNMAVLSSEKNPVVQKRCQKLKIECFSDLGFSKAEMMKKYASDNKFNLKNCIFMGNDLNDMECMNLVGYSVAPSNANEKICSIANYVTHKSGGRGAVRELCDLILKRNQL